ncbi:hypothetical protein TRIP_E150012 [uncultured Spirochaetota bacterium]|uniref:Uncharacterized protein n=1 Tax=uncultured Spirochaetota bacterium TaxID=460511 RepID=A0A652ZSK9_9SPIR|nr:hypothetical protein TRIP_E150012 [uncultured Spirochaetota bacterium]
MVLLRFFSKAKSKRAISYHLPRYLALSNPSTMGAPLGREAVAQEKSSAEKLRRNKVFCETFFISILRCFRSLAGFYKSRNASNPGIISHSAGLQQSVDLGEYLSESLRVQFDGRFVEMLEPGYGEGILGHAFGMGKAAPGLAEVPFGEGDHAGFTQAEKVEFVENRMEMQGPVLDGGADRNALGAQGFAEFCQAAPGVGAMVEAALGVVPAAHGRGPALGVGAVIADMGRQMGKVGQAVPEVPHGLVDFRDTPVVVLELNPAHGGAHLVHAMLVAAHGDAGEFHEFRVGELIVLGEELRRGACALVKTEGDGSFEHGAVVGEKHARFADGEGLGCHQAHDGDVAQGAAGPALVFGALGVGRVLDYHEAVFSGYGKDSIHVAGMGRVVHDHDSLGARAYAVFDIVRIDAEAFLLDFREIDRRAQAQGRSSAGPVGHGGADYLVPSPDAGGVHGAQEGGGAVAVAQGIVHPQPGGHFSFELLGDFRAAHGPGVKDIQNRFFVFFGDYGPEEKLFGFGFYTGLAAVDRQFVHGATSLRSASNITWIRLSVCGERAAGAPWRRVERAGRVGFSRPYRP